jgi:probable HAF family extracellular repeat protein
MIVVNGTFPRIISFFKRDFALFRCCTMAAGVLCLMFYGVEFVSAAPSYTVIDLGGTTSNAHAVNASGQVAGVTNGNACLWTNGTMNVLGTLGGVMSNSYDINASGQVVGCVYEGAPNYVTHAFVYSDGMMSLLDPFSVSNKPTAWSQANGINDGGQIVGSAINANGNNDAFIYSNGTVTDLCVGSAININANGQVVGADTTNGKPMAFLYSNGTMTHLGTLPNYTYGSIAFAINADGQIAGTSYYTNNQYARAFLYSNGTMTDLGMLRGYLQSWAYGINDNGQVVGEVATSSGNSTAFLYNNGTMTDLNKLIDPASGWTLVNANAINNSGQIVGYGYNSHGQQDAFLLTPVPEPSILVLFGMGIVGLLTYTWRRRKQLV